MFVKWYQFEIIPVGQILNILHLHISNIWKRKY